MNGLIEFYTVNGLITSWIKINDYGFSYSYNELQTPAA